MLVYPRAEAGYCLDPLTQQSTSIFPRGPNSICNTKLWSIGKEGGGTKKIANPLGGGQNQLHALDSIAFQCRYGPESNNW